MGIREVAVIGIVLVCACVATPTTTSFYEGISLREFSASPTRVRGDGTERVELFLKLENTGDAFAQDVGAVAFNYADLGGINNVTFGDMAPRGGEVPGETASFSFVFSVPERALGIEDTITPGVRVKFNYSSSARIDLIVIPKDDWQGTQDQVSLMLPESGSTDGPIKLDLETSKHPVVVSRDYNSFGLKLNIENLGQGRLWSDGLGKDYFDDIRIEIPEGVGLAVPRNCDFSGDLKDNRTLVADNIEFKRMGHSHKILICRFNVTDIGVQSTYQFLASANYRYQIDRFTSLSIIGTEPV